MNCFGWLSRDSHSLVPVGGNPAVHCNSGQIVLIGEHIEYLHYNSIYGCISILGSERPEECSN
jgi:hypothetical protein